MPRASKTTTKKTAANKKSNSEVMLGVRCDKELRDAFVQACDRMDTSASREVRRFMRSYLAKYGQEEMF